MAEELEESLLLRIDDSSPVVEAHHSEADGPPSRSDISLSTERHVAHLLKVAYPIVLSNVMFMSINLVSMSFVGHISSQALASSVLATTVFTSTGLTVMQGFTSALETICGNAYGRGAYDMVGLSVQRALILNTIMCTIILTAWVYAAQPVLNMFIQDHTVVSSACRYLRIMSPGLFLSALNETTKRYLSCQTCVKPITLSTLLSCCLCPLYNYIFIHFFGLDGAAITNVITIGTQACSLVIMAMVIDMRKPEDGPKTWNGFSKKALEWQGYPEFLKLALPGFIMVLSEWIAFEMLVIMSGMLPGAYEIGAMGVMESCSSVAWTIVSGIGFSTSILVSTSLGSGKYSDAETFARISLKMSLILEVAMAILLLLFRNVIGRLFSSSEDVSQLISSAMPIFAASLLPDGINICMQNILKACGKQNMGAIVNSMYLLVGLPSSAYLAFACHYGIHGLWGGIVIVNTLLAVILYTVYHKMDFESEADAAAVRVAAHSNID